MLVPEDKTKRKMKFADLPIDVQFDKGDRRHYPAANGYPEYNVTMKAIYGEVPGTKGTDGDPVDVYIGGNAKSVKVFVLRQMKFPKYDAFDEEKCMLGFDSAEEAKTCYLKHHQNKKIFGGIKEFTMDQFKERLGTKGLDGKKLAMLAEVAMRGKLSADQLAAVYQSRTRNGILGAQPETAEVPSTTTSFNAAVENSAKVAVLNRLMNIGASHLAHPVAQKALHAPSPEDALLELAQPAVSKVVDAAKKLVKRAELDFPIKASCGDELAHKMERAAIDDKYKAKLRALSDRREGRDTSPRLKKAAAGRVARIADRVDDVGIGMLATPYAAEGVGKLLAHRSGRLGAIGRGAQAVGHALHEGPHKNKWELAGLGLVAPGVVHPIAKGIDRVLPGRAPAAQVKNAALEAYAATLNPEFEYFTEPQKLAYLGALRQMVPQAKQLLQRGAAAVQGGVQAAKGAVNPGAAATVVPGSPAAAMGRVLTPGNVAKAGVLAAGAVGAIGAYKGVKGMANFLGHEHQHPIAAPLYEAPRVI